MLQFRNDLEKSSQIEHKEVQKKPSLVDNVKSFFRTKVRSFVDKTLEASPIAQGVKAVANTLRKKEETVVVKRMVAVPTQERPLTTQEQAEADRLMAAGLAEYDRIEAEAAEFLNPVNVQEVAEVENTPVISEQIEEDALVTDAEIKAKFPDFNEEELSIAKGIIEEARRNIQAEAMQAASALDHPEQSDTPADMMEYADAFADFEDGTNPFETFEVDGDVATQAVEAKEKDTDALYADIDISDPISPVTVQNNETKRVASKVFVPYTPKVPLQTPTNRPAVDEELEDFIMPNQYKVLEQRKAIQPLMEEGKILYGEALKELEDTVNDPKTTLFDLPAIAAKFAGVPVEEVLKDDYGNIITPQERIFATLMLFEEQDLRKELFYERNKYTGAYIDKYGLNQSEPGTITDINEKRTVSEESPHGKKALIRDMLGLKKKYEAVRKEIYKNVATERTATLMATPRSKWVFIADYIMDVRNIKDPLKRQLLKDVVKKYITVPELRMLNMAKVSKKLAPKPAPKTFQTPKKTTPKSGGPNSVA